MSANLPDISTTRFVLPPDAKFLPVSELSARLQARIGRAEAGQSVITRPGFRITTRLVPGPLAALMGEFREPNLLTDAVLRFSQAHGQDPLATLDLAFDALATLIEARILVPLGSPDTQAPEPSLGAGQAFAGVEIESLVRSLEDTEVYRARQPAGGCVALKVAREGRPAAVRLIVREAEMLDRLGGVDAPKLLGHGTEQGRAYVVSEWCDGVSIAVTAQQARAARDRRRLHRLVTRLLEAYGRVHARGVVHGDVHPGNCLVGEDGRVVLLDFGNARLSGGQGDPHDLARTGIPQFYDPAMASAILAGEIPPAATPAAEQFSVSVLAYLLLTGLHPIETSAVQDELLRNLVERAPLPFTARGVTAWPAVEAVIRRGLAREPGARFPSVADLAQAFAAAGREPRRPRPWPDPAKRRLDAVIDAARNLEPSTEEPLRRAWLALRAALALDDAQLLAAADVLVSRATPGWAAASVDAAVARARSDASAERQAVERFLSAVQPLMDRFEAVAVLLAAAEMLDGAALRKVDVTPLVRWASERLDQLLVAEASEGRVGLGGEPLLTLAALSLARTGAVPLPAGRMDRLEAHQREGIGSAWLWAAAYDVFAQPRFRTLALEAGRPKDPAARGFTLLRIHQLTGDTGWVSEARRLVVRRAGDQDLERDLALLLIELMAPARAVLPAFLCRDPWWQSCHQVTIPKAE